MKEKRLSEEKTNSNDNESTKGAKGWNSLDFFKFIFSWKFLLILITLIGLYIASRFFLIFGIIFTIVLIFVFIYISKAFQHDADLFEDEDYHELRKLKKQLDDINKEILSGNDDPQLYSNRIIFEKKVEEKQEEINQKIWNPRKD